LATSDRTLLLIALWIGMTEGLARMRPGEGADPSRA
jgi:hypothetical protein